MSVALLEEPMTRRNDVTVKIDADVTREAKMVAASRDQSLAEYLSGVLRPIVRQDLERATGELFKGVISGSKPKKTRS